MKLKNKLSLMTLCIVIFIMTLSTVSVWVIISQQNREASADLIRKSFGVIKDDLSSKREKLLADSRQIAGLSDMNMKIELLGGAESVLSYALTKNIYRDLSEMLSDDMLRPELGTARCFSRME
ncbi:hypothetical protein QUF72_15925 [Desulfobacterales bacterium HSG2]|nr:hypothetical protein [Desulfobacterales bacterium HSG2]